MQYTPFISVIMAVYNHEAFLRPAVESVLAQTFPEWELILINNGSTDRSPAIVDELARRDARILPIHQANLGLAAARNRGNSLARGPWIAYLDSDDLWFPHALQTFASFLQERPQARFIYGYAHRLRDAAVTPRRPQHQHRPADTADLFRRMFLVPLAVCHRRELWERAGQYDPRLRWCDDYDLFLRMSLHARLEPIGVPLGLRRRHAGNMSARTGASQQAEAEMLLRFAERHCHAFLDGRTIARRLGQVYARAARCYLRERRFAEAAAMARQALQTAPSWRYRMLSRVCAWLAPHDAQSAHALAARA
jgi:glycosyltransferase involved in cell wall biosynthesis